MAIIHFKKDVWQKNFVICDKIKLNNYTSRERILTTFLRMNFVHLFVKEVKKGAAVINLSLSIIQYLLLVVGWIIITMLFTVNLVKVRKRIRAKVKSKNCVGKQGGDSSKNDSEWIAFEDDPDLKNPMYDACAGIESLFCYRN